MQTVHQPRSEEPAELKRTISDLCRVVKELQNEVVMQGHRIVALEHRQQ
jgi:hypothetical protein